MATINRPEGETPTEPSKKADLPTESGAALTPDEPEEYLFWGINEFYVAP